MPRVRTMVVQVGAKQSVNYCSNEVSVMTTVDMDHDDDFDSFLAYYTAKLRAHCDGQIAEWAPPSPKPQLPLRNASRPNQREFYDPD